MLMWEYARDNGNVICYFTNSSCSFFVFIATLPSNKQSLLATLEYAVPTGTARGANGAQEGH